MKIGILTFWKTEDNYGQLLQCYATQTFLRSLGHETFLVKATNGHEYVPTFKGLLKDKIRTAYRLKSYPIYLLRRALGSAFYTLTHFKLRPHVTCRGFEDFRRQYLNCTQETYTLGQLRQNPPQADAYVVGSDQIWNTTDGIYFLSWAPDNVRKVSMAASFGARHSSPDFCHLIGPWLKRFDLITVRETSGIGICADAGRTDAHLAPDPTLLLRADDYLKIASRPQVNEPYLFIYFLGTRTAINWPEIHRFAKERGLKIVYVGSQGQEDKYKKEEPTIGQWLALMANASFVITNSFHCAVFAMQFRRRFMAYPVSGPAAKMNDRLTTLLTPLGLQSRVYAGSLAPIEEEIDYDKVFLTLDDNTARAKALFAPIFG
ncbi:MAG: polysaccharide pyruvyl transferase family protein [Pseudoflavonifractor sp.]|nr:polysaccharide pyruvyl transferase family protein [Alloprevotella sp.]MCM1116080.1 polysaccharide pyruvyl transferase family protein [Pseudoflavonifractor sp.]